jgi:hypothetical protein
LSFDPLTPALSRREREKNGNEYGA